jgi:SAM-dependent methyltransferase
MHWKHGYYTETGYTYGYYAETMPTRLRWAALLQGQIAPEQRFRYLDAGCGQGLNLIVAAACHPDSEFVGIDFLPEHIAHAQALAQRCGLTNVRFIEGDFIAWSEDPSALGQFDYVVCHGISTWIAPVVKKALFSLIGQCLKPGGIFYNSYNTYPGWLAVTPFQHLVLLEQRQRNGFQALEAAKNSMARLKELNGGIISQLPGLQLRLDSMQSMEPAYLVQEYNNQFWQPVFVTQMMDDLSAVKLEYLGTATLSEAFEGALPAALREWLNQHSNPMLKEQLRDYALNQGFRRDLYVKGRRKPWANAYPSMLQSQRFRANPTAAMPAEGQSWVIKGGAMELKGEAPFYGSLMQHLIKAGEQGLTLAQLMETQPNAAYRSAVTQTVSLLVHGNWAFPYLPEATGKKVNARAVNAALAQSALDGAPYRYLILPKAGCAYTLAESDWLLINLDITGVPESKWLQAITEGMTRTGKTLMKDGKPVTDPATAAQLFEAAMNDFVRARRPLFRSLGAY